VHIKSLDFTQVIPYKEPFDIEKEEPAPWYRQGYIQDKVYAITMAIQNLAFNDWILIDKNYPSRMELKKGIIADVGNQVIECFPPGFDSCVEFLELLVQYLPRRYPTIFTVSSDGTSVTNHVTGETLDLRPSNFNTTDATSHNHPLYLCSRLTEDDISILIYDPAEDEYRLQAALFGFPAGFFAAKKMGLSLSEIHGPVPTYEAKLKMPMNKFFKNVGPSRMVMRLNWGINDTLKLYLPEGGHLYEDEGDEGQADEGIDINQVQLRIERQTLRRLPRTRAICFLAKTYVFPLVEVAQEPGFAAKLGGLVRKLPEKFAFYKRKPIWGQVVLEYLDEMAERYPGEEDE
jgi:hypothetical protein